MKKDAVILLNMGGPNNLDEVELFLKNMFNDPNILTMKSSLLRKFVATMITFFRTESSQEIYRELGGKSPIVDLSKNLVAALQEKLGKPFQSSKPDGMGLGLFLTQATLNRYGGTVCIKASPEGGTITRVILPLRSES